MAFFTLVYSLEFFHPYESWPLFGGGGGGRWWVVGGGGGVYLRWGVFPLGLNGFHSPWFVVWNFFTSTNRGLYLVVVVVGGWWVVGGGGGAYLRFGVLPLGLMAFFTLVYCLDFFHPYESWPLFGGGGGWWVVAVGRIYGGTDFPSV